jgi:hypothetical protein
MLVDVLSGYSRKLQPLDPVIERFRELRPNRPKPGYGDARWS